MNTNIKNIFISVSFVLFIFGFMILNILTPDSEISYSERRKFTTAPPLSLKNIINGDYFDESEYYSLDQFVFRDDFRSIKAFAKFNILKQKDNNGIYIINNYISKMEYPLKDKSVINASLKLNEVYNRYLKNLNVYYCVIPDKNYFMAERNGYLSLDYRRLTELLYSDINKNMKYIDLFGMLNISDYYLTDIHWNQDKIIKIADKLLSEMNNAELASDSKYIRKELYPFYGSYYGQAAMKLLPDKMIYLTNDTIENSVVYDHILKSSSKVYMSEKFGGIDSYDVFLSGAKPLISISNPACKTGRELLIFRDSFGSSIAPLLLGGYSKITLIDLRYISSDLLENYIDFSEYHDALFLYNAQVINNSAMLK